MSRSLLVLCFVVCFWTLGTSFALAQEEVPVPESTPSPASNETTTPVSADGLFEKGLEAYQKKEFGEARDAFKRILDQSAPGSEPPVSVLNNLALSALQLDQKPLALAAWRKALSLQPGFRPARMGRDYMETQSAMRPFERDPFSLWQRRTLELFSIFQILWVEGLLFGLVGYLGIRYWSERRNALETESPLPAFPFGGAALLIVLMVSSGVIVLKIKEMYTSRATVVASKASVRSLPADEGVNLFELSGGTELLVRRTNDGWLQVQNSDGMSGWIKATDAMVTSQR